MQTESVLAELTPLLLTVQGERQSLAESVGKQVAHFPPGGGSNPSQNFGGGEGASGAHMHSFSFPVAWPQKM